MIIIFWTLMIGFMFGAIAKFFEPTLKQGDLFITMNIGLMGSVFGSWLGPKLNYYEFGSYYGLIASGVGAITFLIIYHIYLLKYGPPKSPERPNIEQAE